MSLARGYIARDESGLGSGSDVGVGALAERYVVPTMQLNADSKGDGRGISHSQ